MIEASEYINDLINDIDNTIKGTYNEADGRTYFCNTKWARVGKIIVNSEGLKYRIKAIAYDTYLVADPIDKDNKLALDGVCTIQKPFFITGTKLSANREWTIADNNLENKLPLVWLLEIINEKGFGRGSSYDRQIETKMFFLDETDPSQYYTKQHREQVVVPMQKLMSSFLEVVENDRAYESINDFSFKTFSRFGVERDTGVIENILDANLSGVALNLTLTRYKINCKC